MFLERSLQNLKDPMGKDRMRASVLLALVTLITYSGNSAVILFLFCFAKFG
jgi:hypothetical protein